MSNPMTADEIALLATVRTQQNEIERLQAVNADLLAALQAQEMADADPAASRRKGYFERARELRCAAIAKAKA